MQCYRRKTGILPKLPRDSLAAQPFERMLAQALQEVLALDESGQSVAALRHRTRPILAFQGHPEMKRTQPEAQNERGLGPQNLFKQPAFGRPQRETKRRLLKHMLFKMFELGVGPFGPTLRGTVLMKCKGQGGGCTPSMEPQNVLVT